MELPALGASDGVGDEGGGGLPGGWATGKRVAILMLVNIVGTVRRIGTTAFRAVLFFSEEK